MTVSLVDMKILDSPASTILVTNSEGTRYDIEFPLWVVVIEVRSRALQIRGHALTQREPPIRLTGCYDFGQMPIFCREICGESHCSLAESTSRFGPVDVQASRALSP